MSRQMSIDNHSTVSSNGISETTHSTRDLCGCFLSYKSYDMSCHLHQGCLTSFPVDPIASSLGTVLTISAWTQ
jgi:hypothetical protein